MASPQVSVVIPTFNAAAYLPRALESALSQDGVSLEIIVVDNNSSDNTRQIAEAYAELHPKIIRCDYESKPGAAAARNRGLAIAQGAWIQFLDADDKLLPGKLLRQMTLVNSGTDWVIGASVRQDLAGLESGSLPNPDPWKGLVHNGGVGDTNSNLLRRTKLLELGGQNESLPNCEDNELYFRLLKANCEIVVDYLPGAVYIDRTGHRLSELPDKASRHRMIWLIAEVITFLRENRTDYFKMHSGFFYAALLNAIRILATEHPGEARACYELYFPRGIKLAELDRLILPRFAALYPVLGFGLVEGMRRRLKNVLPAGLKRLIKGRS